jgi:hypothetical protein
LSAPHSLNLGSRVFAAMLLLVPVAVVDLTVWPGHLNADSLNMIAQAKAGQYTNWWSPLFEWVWHPFYNLGFGPGWLLTLQTAGLSVGIYLLLRVVFGRVVSALLAAAICLSPPVFAQLILMGHDMWFLSATMLAFGFGVRGTGAAGRARLGWYLLALIAAWFAQAARQNAVSALVFLFAYLAWVILADAKRADGLARIRSGRWCVVAAIGVAIVMSVALYGEQFGLQKAIGVQSTGPSQVVDIYDLEMLSKEENRNLFPPSIVANRGMTVIDANFNEDNILPMIVNGIGLAHGWPIEGARLKALSHAWKKAVLHHPLDYLYERFRVGLREASITARPYTVYQPNNFGDNSLGIHVENPSLDRLATDYLNLFTDDGYVYGGPLLYVWIYLLLATVWGVILVRQASRNRMIGLIGWCALSVWGLQVSILFASAGSTYRYEDLTIVVALLTTCVMANQLYHQRQNRPAREPLAAG